MQSISNTGLGREERKRDQAKAPKLTGAYRTRREAASYLQSRGYPISYSTLTKVCALGEGPEPAKWWGARPLYTDQGLDAWAEARSHRERPRKQPAGEADGAREACGEAPAPEAAESSHAPDKPTGKAGRRRGKATADA
jgi:hypothetical protein